MNHGTRTNYTSGCRCDACREANATYQRERYQARADVREQTRARQEQKRREAGVEPVRPAPPELLAERARLRERLARAVARLTETPEEAEERRAERRAALAAAVSDPSEHERRLELQRARNKKYRDRLALREATAVTMVSL